MAVELMREERGVEERKEDAGMRQARSDLRELRERERGVTGVGEMRSEVGTLQATSLRFRVQEWHGGWGRRE